MAGSIEGLFGNPLTHIGIGLLGQGQSLAPGRIGAGRGVMQGLLSHSAYRQQQQAAERQAQEMQMRQQQFQMQQQQFAQQQEQYRQAQMAARQRQNAIARMMEFETDPQKRAAIELNPGAASTAAFATPKAPSRENWLEKGGQKYLATDAETNAMLGQGWSKVKSDPLVQMGNSPVSVQEAKSMQYRDGSQVQPGTPWAEVRAKGGMLVESDPLVSKAREGLATVGRMKRKLDRYKDAYTESGGARVIPGRAQGKMEQTLTSLQLEIKNLEELGVLAGPDMELIEKLTGDPTSLKEWLLETRDEGTTADRIRGLEEIINNAYEILEQRHLGVRGHSEIFSEMPYTKPWEYNPSANRGPSEPPPPPGFR